MDPNFLDSYPLPQGGLLQIKEEPSEQRSSLLSPPTTPSSSSLALPSLSTISSRRKGSVSSLAGPHRPRPYPNPSNRISRSRRQEPSTMSSYGSWNHGAQRSSHGRAHPSVERRSSDGENQTAFVQGSQYTVHDYMSSDIRQMSVSTLSGAMGDATIAHSRQSKSPASSHSGSVYGGNMQPQNHDLTWNTTHPNNMTIAMNPASYPGVPGHGGLFSNVGQPNIDMSQMNEYGTTRNVSPESLSPHSPYGQGQMVPQHAANGMLAFPGSMPQYPPSPDSADLIQQLQRRVHELERECHRAKSALALAHSPSGLPNAPPSAQFHNQWRARTEARKRIFCSLNRAGNALCSWHDSRRERRTYPPRNAPPGYLNCGCTYEEALFEESLARHGVGSYHPGESVRMDPALRNPLLKLLQARYNYKDGDFDHDPVTETWNDGESPVDWDQKAQSGALVRRRNENAH